MLVDVLRRQLVTRDCVAKSVPHQSLSRGESLSPGISLIHESLPPEISLVHESLSISVTRERALMRGMSAIEGESVRLVGGAPATAVQLLIVAGIDADSFRHL